MTKFLINRSKSDNLKGETTKIVKEYETLQEAMDDLYMQARRHEYEMTIDNSPKGPWGFCLWQIQVIVGQWRYYITEENEEDLLF